MDQIVLFLSLQEYLPCRHRWLSAIYKDVDKDGAKCMMTDDVQVERVRWLMPDMHVPWGLMEVLNFPGQSGVSALLCLDFRIKVLSTALLLSDGQRKYISLFDIWWSCLYLKIWFSEYIFLYKDQILFVLMPETMCPLCRRKSNTGKQVFKLSGDSSSEYQRLWYKELHFTANPSNRRGSYFVPDINYLFCNCKESSGLPHGYLRKQKETRGKMLEIITSNKANFRQLVGNCQRRNIKKILIQLCCFDESSMAKFPSEVLKSEGKMSKMHNDQKYN